MNFLPNKSKEKFFYLLSNLGVFLLFVLSLTVHKGHTYGVIIFYLSILLIPFWWKQRIISKEYYKLCLVIGFSAATGMLNGWFSDSGLSESSIKYLLSTLILLYLVTYPPKPQTIWWSVSIGAIAAGLFALYFSFIEPIIRVHKYLNPIHFGDYAALFSLLCICGLIPLKNQNKALIVCLLIGSILGFTASVLSGTRGAWLSFIIVITALIIINYKHSSRNLTLVILVFSALIGCITFLGQDRIRKATQEVQNYHQNKSSSVGARLEMWKFGISTGIKYPFFGANDKDINKEKELWILEHGEQVSRIKEFNHLHNEFINIFAKKGTIGLISLLLLFLYPLSIYLKNHKKISSHLSPEKKRLSNAGISHLIAFMGFGLTESFIMTLNNAFILFMIPLCFIYAAYNREKF